MEGETWLYFNSRPSARGDLRGNKRNASKKKFQFTPLREGRQALQNAYISVDAISIHAPPRGATSHTISTQERTSDFNSRPSARGDLDEAKRQGFPDTFQFTPLREGRLVLAPNLCNLQLDFNSRPSARGDSKGARAW